MAQTVLAVAASSWAVLMGIAPVRQIRRMLRERSSRDVSIAYFAILLVGFLLWIGYGAAAGLSALVIPKSPCWSARPSSPSRCGFAALPRPLWAGWSCVQR